MDTSRRSLLKAGLGAAALSAFGVGWSQTGRRGSVRVILFTDAHIGAKDQAERTAKALELAQARKPDLIVWGGDNVMNVDGNKTYESARDQFALWKSVVAAHTKAPHHAVIGNHDIWWAAADHPQAAMRDKSFAIQTFGLPKRYYAVDAGGWRFLMLDVFHRDGCHVDAEQLEWMQKQIADAKGSVCLVSHAPILTATHFMELGAPKDGGWKVPASWQVGNAVDLVKLFWKHPKVKLALSGHMHQIDRLDFHGVSYVCGGAVSGSWWGGDYLGFAPAWVELELSPDGLTRVNPVFWEESRK